MSVRASASKVGGTTSATTADQSRMVNGARRGQTAEVGSTTATKRSTRFRISAAMSPALNEADSATNASHTQAQTETQARKPPPSAFSQPGMSNNEQGSTERTANPAPRSFLQTRRRQPSTNNARLPLGPRPVDLQESTRSNISRYERCDCYLT